MTLFDSLLSTQRRRLLFGYLNNSTLDANKLTGWITLISSSEMWSYLCLKSSSSVSSVRCCPSVVCPILLSDFKIFTLSVYDLTKLSLVSKCSSVKSDLVNSLLFIIFYVQSSSGYLTICYCIVTGWILHIVVLVGTLKVCKDLDIHKSYQSSLVMVIKYLKLSSTSTYEWSIAAISW